MPSGGIAIILPPREGYSDTHFGAISLSVRDFVHYSADADRITVYSGVPEKPFAHGRYQPVDMARPRYLGMSHRYLWHLYFLLRASGPRLIEVHNRPRLAAMIARFGIAPVTLFLHNDPRSMRKSRTPRARHRLSQRLAGVLCVSHYIADCWGEGLDDGACPVYVTPLGIALPAMADTPKENSILFVGRTVAHKGAHVFARALALALPHLPQWSGRIIGARRLGQTKDADAYEQQLAELIAAAGPRAQWSGSQSHAATMDAFARAAIVVIPSLWEEPFGRVAIEAMSHGCAVITSGRGGLAEIVADAGKITDPSPDALAGAMIELAQQPHQRYDLQRRARLRAESFAIDARSRYVDACRHACMRT